MRQAVRLFILMALFLSGTCPADAENHLATVPAGHWAYDVVIKLTEDGVVDGYAKGVLRRVCR